MADFEAGSSLMSNGTNSSSHSRESSMSSERSSRSQNKENTYANTPTNALARQDSDASDLSARQLILNDGGKLAEESRTEINSPGIFNSGFNGVKNGDSESGTGSPDVPPRQPSGGGGGTGTARHKVHKSGGALASSIPEEEIAIPGDGNLAAFSADAMATFLRYLRLEDRVVNHLHRNGLDGRKFGRLKDSDLDNLQLANNPVLLFFRDKTAPAVTKKPKQRLPFVL